MDDGETFFPHRGGIVSVIAEPKGLEPVVNVVDIGVALLLWENAFNDNVSVASQVIPKVAVLGVVIEAVQDRSSPDDAWRFR
jgi:hypothetical protein